MFWEVTLPFLPDEPYSRREYRYLDTTHTTTAITWRRLTSWSHILYSNRLVDGHLVGPWFKFLHLHLIYDLGLVEQ
jgi:hypothetical protein